MTETCKIHDLRDDEKPREKILAHKGDCLTDVELLAIIIGHGSKESSCIDIARELLNSFGSLNNVITADPVALIGIVNIGKARQTQFLALAEIIKRIQAGKIANTTECKNPQTAFEAVKLSLYNKDKEEVVVIHLNSRNKIICKELLSIGTVSESLVSAREILKSALAKNSSGVIIAHNHPSGDVTPSSEDIRISRRLAKVLEISGLKLVDHLIVHNDKFSSLKSLGILERR